MAKKSTARHAARSGFGSTAAGRAAVTGKGRPTAAPAAGRTSGGRPARPGGGPPAPPAGTGGGRSRSATPPPRTRQRPAPPGRSRSYRPTGKPGGGSRNPFGGLGSVRAQHMLLGELMLVLVLLVLDDVMADGDVTQLPVQASATAGLFLLLALISTGGRSAERIAVAFGGLTVLAVLMKRFGALGALSAMLADRWFQLYPGRFPNQPAPPAPAPDTAATPGPPITDPAPPASTRVTGNGRVFAV